MKIINKSNFNSDTVFADLSIGSVFSLFDEIDGIYLKISEGNQVNAIELDSNGLYSIENNEIIKHVYDNVTLIIE